MSTHYEGPGLLRIWEIIAPKGPIPVSRSTWLAGVKTGIFPAPVKLGPRITAWNRAAVLALVEQGAPFKSETALIAKRANPPPRKGT